MLIRTVCSEDKHDAWGVIRTPSYQGSSLPSGEAMDQCASCISMPVSGQAPTGSDPVPLTSPLPARVCSSRKLNHKRGCKSDARTLNRNAGLPSGVLSACVKHEYHSFLTVGRKIMKDDYFVAPENYLYDKIRWPSPGQVWAFGASIEDGSFSLYLSFK